MRRLIIIYCVLVANGAAVGISGQDNAAIRLTKTIPLPNVSGRIDHMAVDVEHQRLYVAALGNGTLEVIDLRTAKVIQSVTGLKEPQGVLYIPETGMLFVATGGDGECHAYSGSPLNQVSVLHIGDDADNIRYDAADKWLYVGYGGGALAIVDPATMKRLGDIKLAGHPESFQIERFGPRIYVNIPDARQIAVVDRRKKTVVATWPMDNLRGNFPMALDEAAHRVLVATRAPAKLVALDSGSGRTIQELDCAGDADDLFFESITKVAYVSCGEGIIDVFAERDPDHYREVARIPTSAGARTSLWATKPNQLLLAVPARRGQEAGIRIYKAD